VRGDWVVASDIVCRAEGCIQLVDFCFGCTEDRLMGCGVE